MRNKENVLKRTLNTCVLVTAAALCMTSLTVQAADLSACVGTVFSTEEDFMSPVGEKRDGNPVVSDGDLLALDPATGSVVICARNRELLPPGTLVEVDQALGLDAVDSIAPEQGIIAFSTELDEQFGLFGHGDVLFPNGTVIPNAVLVARFQLPDNMGLDAIHFTGKQEAILEVIKLAREIGPEKLKADPNTYLERLKAIGVDIWFSIEGTSEPPPNPQILDGDLLSAVAGSKVAPQQVLLSPPIPAGITDRGVDFGLDAVTADRRGNRERIQFSTEILYRGRPDPFTDGDILAIGGTVNLAHESLIKTLKPRADFLGLDALSIVSVDLAGQPHIDSLCGDPFNAIDFGTDGLWRANFATMAPGDPPRRPCGMFVPVGGTLPTGLSTPSGDITRFRVTYESLNGALPPLFGGIKTTWRLRAPHPVFPWLCAWAPASTLKLETDGNGWMNARDFIDAYTGNPAGITGDGFMFGCANPHLRLAVWDTKALANDRENDLMRLRLEWETTGSVTPVASPFAYNVQLDNILPQMPPYPNNLEVRLNDGSGTKVPACGEAPSSASEFQVWAEFEDPHYWFFTLQVEGGDPPTSHNFLSPSGDIRHEYFENPDGPGPVGPLKNTNDLGTIGMGLQHLRNIDMTELGDSFKRCCYLLELRVYDASIRHTFSGINPGSSLDLNDTRAITTFEAGS